MIEYIKINEKIISIIIRQSYSNDGINFFSPKDFGQQIGFIKRSKDFEVFPHYHNKIKRYIETTFEVLLIKKGKISLDYYDNNQVFKENKILNSGDVVLLGECGHGIKMLEDTEIIEIKQGPYIEEDDKIRFVGNKTK